MDLFFPKKGVKDEVIHRNVNKYSHDHNEVGAARIEMAQTQSDIKYRVKGRGNYPGPDEKSHGSSCLFVGVIDATALKNSLTNTVREAQAKGLRRCLFFPDIGLTFAIKAGPILSISRLIKSPVKFFPCNFRY